jgi:glycosyltransferase involved in cell wall biosynthesis
MVSIILTVKNEENKIGETLAALTEIDYPSYEIILIDGGSTDQTLDIAQKFAINIVKTSNSYPGQARNIGIAHAQGNIIAFTDGDCIPNKDWLTNAVSLLKTNQANGVGGPLLPYKKSTFLAKAILNSLSAPLVSAGSTNFIRHNQQRYVKSLPSSNAIYPKTILEDVGFFSDELRYCEDTELNYRIINKNYKLLFSPNVVVQHNWKVASFLSLFKLMLNYGAGRAIAVRKFRYLFSLINLLPSVSLLFLLLSFIISTQIALLATIIYVLIILVPTISAIYQHQNLSLIYVAPFTYIFTHTAYAIGFIFGLIIGERYYDIQR